MRLTYNFDGNRVEWWIKGSSIYYTTNADGEGVFVVSPSKNSRKQLIGTCDFYLRGSKDSKRAKIRTYMRNRKEE